MVIGNGRWFCPGSTARLDTSACCASQFGFGQGVRISGRDRGCTGLEDHTLALPISGNWGGCQDLCFHADRTPSTVIPQAPFNGSAKIECKQINMNFQKGIGRSFFSALIDQNLQSFVLILMTYLCIPPPPHVLFFLLWYWGSNFVSARPVLCPSTASLTLVSKSFLITLLLFPSQRLVLCVGNIFPQSNRNRGTVFPPPPGAGLVKI